MYFAIERAGKFPRLSGINAALLFAVFFSVAQAAPLDLPWFSRSWQADEGLPDNTVTGIAQTSDGFLWVATQGGLASFDGVRFREYPVIAAAGASGSLIQVLFHDKQDRLWLAKNRGLLVCLDGGKVSAFSAGKGPSQVEARNIVEDREGGIWIAYIQGEVVRFHNGVARAYTSQDGLPETGTCQLTTDQQGTLWFAQAGKVGTFQNDKFVTMAELEVQRITSARQGGLWLARNNRLFRFLPGSKPTVVADLPINRPDLSPTVLLEDRDGNLWFGTRNAGLFRFNGEKFEAFRLRIQRFLACCRIAKAVCGWAHAAAA